MGGAESSVKSKEQFLQEFEEMKRESDVHFGSVIIYRNKKNPKLIVLMKEKHFNSDTEFQGFVEKARIRSQLIGENISPLIETVVTEDKKLCATSYTCYLGYEFHERTLEKLLRHRKTYSSKEEQLMTEPDAWGVFSNLTNAGKLYKDRGMAHGDIQPACIFILNDKTLKLIDSSFMNDQESAFHRRYHDFQYKSPLSPQAMSALSLGPKYSDFNREKNDVWSIGICVLVCLTNEDFNIFYDWTNQEINYSLLSQRFQMLEAMGYSEELIFLIKRTLEKDENKRISLVELQSQIKNLSQSAYELPRIHAGPSQSVSTEYSSQSTRGGVNSYQQPQTYIHPPVQHIANPSMASQSIANQSLSSPNMSQSPNMSGFMNGANNISGPVYLNSLPQTPDDSRYEYHLPEQNLSLQQPQAQPLAREPLQTQPVAQQEYNQSPSGNHSVAYNYQKPQQVSYS